MTRSRRRPRGSGSIYRRSSDGKWAAAVRAPAELGGRRLYLYGDSAAEVEAKLVDLNRRLQRGSLPSSTRLTVGQQLIDWLEATRANVRPSTWIGYEGAARLHLAPLVARPLVSLTAADVRRLTASLIASGLAPRTVAHALKVLRMAIKQAVADGVLDRNVAEFVAPPRAAQIEVQPFDLEQAHRFLDAVKGDRLETMFALVLAVGLRAGEASGLTWDRIDFEKGTIRITAALRPIPREFRKAGAPRLQLVDPKTASGRRIIALPAFVIASLRAHKVRQLEEKLVAGRRWKGNGLDLVFTTPIGTPLDHRNVARRYKEILVEAGLPPLRFHDLRHSAATMMLAAGFDLRTISEVLGHRTPTMSAVYSHVLPSLRSQVASVIDRVLTEREAR